MQSLKHLCNRHKYLAFRLKRAGQILERDAKVNPSKAFKAWKRESHEIQAKMKELHGATKLRMNSIESLDQLVAAE